MSFDKNNLNSKTAIILCGGLGSRLRDVVSDRPKPMADFQGRPFLDILIRHLVSFGIENIILSTGYMSEVIENNLHAWNSIANVCIAKEEELLGTGGAVKNAIGHTTAENFFIVNGDSYCKGDLISMEQQHFDNKANLTMLLTKVEDAREFGTVEVNNHYEVQQFIEKNIDKKCYPESKLVTKLVNAGIYLCNRTALMSFPKADKFSLEYDVFPELISHSFYGFITDAPLFDIGTAKSYANAVKILGNIQ